MIFSQLNLLFLLTLIHGRLLPYEFGDLSLWDHVYFNMSDSWRLEVHLFTLKRNCVCVCSEADLGHIISGYTLKIISISFTASFLLVLYYFWFLIKHKTKNNTRFDQAEQSTEKQTATEKRGEMYNYQKLQSNRFHINYNSIYLLIRNS